MADIFLSYAWEDLEKTRALAKALEQEGWSVFWDRTSILPGQKYKQIIEQEIEGASCLIVVWSAASRDSNWVNGEADMALELNKLVQIHIENIRPPINYRSMHCEDFSTWSGAAEKPEFKKLREAVRRLAGNNQPNRQASIIPTADSAPAIHTPPKTTSSRMPFEPEMIEIPAGTFRMGSKEFGDEKPIHTVTFAKPFKLGKYPVTFAEYDAYAEQTGREKPDDRGWGRKQRPVINVNWQEAVDYAVWLSQIRGKSYRLPSEAEWEYACRGGSTTEFFWGDDASLATEYAWFEENAGEKTQPVGQKKPNPFGLYDMAGNVWEWLQDNWHNVYNGAPDNGSAWQTGGNSTLRVLRGGSWNYTPPNLRSADRNWVRPDDADNYLGFRLAQD